MKLVHVDIFKFQTLITFQMFCSDLNILNNKIVRHINGCQNESERLFMVVRNPTP